MSFPAWFSVPFLNRQDQQDEESQVVLGWWFPHPILGGPHSQCGGSAVCGHAEDFKEPKEKTIMVILMGLTGENRRKP